MPLFTHEYYMRQALREAHLAYEQGEIPVGCVVVCEEKIIARTHNLSEKLTDVTAHAEMQAITTTSLALNSKYLKSCTLYVTLEPCFMCAGAIFWSQMGSLVYGACDHKQGFSSKHNLSIHPKTNIEGQILEKECNELLSQFFQSKRQ